MTVRRFPSTVINHPRLAPLRLLLALPLVALCAISLTLGALFTHLGGEVRESEMIAADQAILRAVDSATASWPVAVAENVSLIGSELVIGGVALGLTFWFLWRRRWLDALFIAAAIGGSATFTVVVKHVIGRARPVAFFRVPESGNSFPSGHTLSATCLALALAFLLWHGARGRSVKVIGTLLLAAAVFAVGMSRLVLGVHYPTDVLGSVLLGAAWLAALIALRVGYARWMIGRKT